jgi:hypothetical protein
MDVGYVLRRTRSITWRQKALWLFGFLVSLGTTSTRLGVARIQWNLVVEELPSEVQGPLLDFVNGPYVAIAVAILVVLALAVGLGLMLLNGLGRIGLVHQARAAEEYGIVVLKGGWMAAKRYLWTVFFIRLLLGLPVAVVILIGLIPSIVTWLFTVGQDPELAVLGILGTELFRLTCSAPAWGVAALLSIPIGLLQRLAVRACVLEHLDTRGSCVRAWEILREHLGEVVLVWVILFGLGAGVVLLLGLPLGVVWLLFLTTARMTIVFSPLLSIGLTLLLGLVAWLVSILIVGVTETFSSALWTLAYRELTGLGRTGEEEDLQLVVASTHG